MATRALSRRETEIVELSTRGLTNKGIAAELGLSLGTVNTYWSRIRIKTGGKARTDTVARLLNVRTQDALSESEAQNSGIESVMQAAVNVLIQDQIEDAFQHTALMALLRIAFGNINWTAWATDIELRIHLVATGTVVGPASLPHLEEGSNVRDVFQTAKDSQATVSCHQSALNGKDCTLRLGSKENPLILRSFPLSNEQAAIIGCISVLTEARDAG
jgi:DNA-binding CsgD family transcriptional regulator